MPTKLTLHTGVQGFTCAAYSKEGFVFTQNNPHSIESSLQIIQEFFALSMKIYPKLWRVLKKKYPKRLLV